MEMPKPSDGHLKLERLAGNWEGKEKLYPSQWSPEERTALVRTHMRAALNGFNLISDYEHERDGVVTYTGHGVFSFDPKAERYSLYWVDSMGSPPETFVGRFDGNVLTVAHGGPGMHARLTYSLDDSKKTLSNKLEMSEDGVSWNLFAEAIYKRR